MSLVMLRRTVCLAAAALAFSLPASAALADEVRITRQLVPAPNAPVTAAAFIDATIDTDDNYVDDERLFLRLEAMPPGSYSLIVNERPNRTISIGSTGRETVSIRLRDHVPQLDVRIIGADSRLYFSGVIDPRSIDDRQPSVQPSEPRKGFNLNVHMQNLAAPDNARAQIQYRANKHGLMFRLRANRLEPDATYDLLSDGVLVDQVTTDRRGRINIRFASAPRNRNEQLLTFDPSQSLFEIADSRSGVIMMSAFIAGGTAQQHEQPSTGDEGTRFPLQTTPEAGRLIASATLWIDRSETELEVDLDRAIPGHEYRVMLDDLVKGSAVAPSNGDLDFSLTTNPRNAGNDSDIILPLSVNPTGRLLRVVDMTSGVVVAWGVLAR